MDRADSWTKNRSLLDVLDERFSQRVEFMEVDDDMLTPAAAMRCDECDWLEPNEQVEMVPKDERLR